MTNAQISKKSSCTSCRYDFDNYSRQYRISWKMNVTKKNTGFFSGYLKVEYLLIAQTKETRQLFSIILLNLAFHKVENRKFSTDLACKNNLQFVTL